MSTPQIKRDADPHTALPPSPPKKKREEEKDRERQEEEDKTPFQFKRPDMKAETGGSGKKHKGSAVPLVGRLPGQHLAATFPSAKALFAPYRAVQYMCTGRLTVPWLLSLTPL